MCVHTVCISVFTLQRQFVYTNSIMPVPSAIPQVDETQINDRSAALGGTNQAPAASSGGLAGALAKALHARQQAIQVSDDSEEEDDDDDDDEWED